MTATPHALYLGRVMHARLAPFRHAFRYRVYALLLDLDRLDRLPWPLVHNRVGLLSFDDRDHGRRDGAALRPWLEDMLSSKGVGAPARIRVLCFPRVFGYCFNPLTIYFCDDAEGRPTAIVYEVKNTFGDQHCYACPVDRPASDGSIAQGHAKELYVSPFFDMEGGYRFRLSPPSEHLSVVIRYGDPAADGDRLIATQTGLRSPLTTRTLLRAILLHPLLTWKIIAGIHVEALMLWRKGARFHSRPNPPIHPKEGHERSSS